MPARRPAAPKRALSYPLATRSTSASWWLMAVHNCAALSLKPNIASELSSGALSVHTRRVCVRTCVMYVCVCGWMDVYIHDICYVMYTPRYRGQIGNDRRASRPSGGLPAPATAPASAHSCHHRLQRERTPPSLDRLLYMFVYIRIYIYICIYVFPKHFPYIFLGCFLIHSINSRIL